MDSTTEELAAKIDNSRAELRSNLQQLEHKVKSAADWRQHLVNHPGLLMAAAFGGGALLGLVRASKRTPSAKESSPLIRTTSSIPAKRTNFELQEGWDAIKGALVGVATSKVKTALGEVLPGFNEQIKNFEASRGARPESQGPEN